MIALSSMTAAAIALRAADSDWIMFLQSTSPSSTTGPILINAVEGRQLLDRLTQLTLNNPYTVYLIGLIVSDSPAEEALSIANDFAAYQIHDWWFDPNPDLMALISAQAQDAISLLLARTHPGGLSDAPVDIEDMAEILDVSVPTVRRMVKAGEIPYLKFGRFYRFVPNDVLASLKR